MFGGVGKVFVDGKVVNKAGTPVSDKSVVKIMAEVPKYVCRWLLHFNNPTCTLLYENSFTDKTLAIPLVIICTSVYPSRAGHKLEAAIEQLDIDVSRKVALDSGLSTGGFTDCLLQYGASFVYGVDVGYGQVIHLFSKSSVISYSSK